MLKVNKLWVVFIACCTLLACMADSSMVKNTEPQVIAGVAPAMASTSKDMTVPVQFYVLNNRSTDVQLLLWNTPLETHLSADIFNVTYTAANEPAQYIGRMVKRGSPTTQDYISISAGERLTRTIDLSLYYDTSRVGQYTVRFAPQSADDIYINNGVPVALDTTVVKFKVP